jgi:hypothetical protein
VNSFLEGTRVMATGIFVISMAAGMGFTAMPLLPVAMH